MYLLQLMDNYVGGWTLLIIGLAETLAVSYCYGTSNTIYIKNCNMITLKCAYFENKRRKYIVVFVFFISICFFIIIAQITIITVSSIFIINDDVVVVIVIVFTVSGVPRFCKDLEVMLGIPVNIYFKVCWYGVSPIAVFVSILLKHRKTQI